MGKVKLFLAAVLLAALVALPGLALADTYNFAGGFNYSGFADWTYNQPFSGTFSYNPVSGIGALSVGTNGFNSSGGILVEAMDNYGPGHDTVFVHNSDWSVFMQLASTANLFTGNTLPASLNLDAFDYLRFLYVSDANFQTGIGDLTKLESNCPAVPVPPGVWLLGSGLLGLAGLGWRRRKTGEEAPE